MIKCLSKFGSGEEIWTSNLGVILITHNVHQAYPVGNRFTVLNRGKSMGTFDKNKLSREEWLSMVAGGEALNKLGIELKELEKKLRESI